MFTNRNLNISFLFSLALHLISMSGVYIIIKPTVRLQDTYTNVNFLGPILEKTAFDIMVEDAAPNVETFYNTSTITESEEHLEIRGPEKMIRKSILPEDKKTEIDIGKKEEKFIAEDRNVYYHLDYKSLDHLMEGPAKGRAVFFKPQFPHLAESMYVDEKYFVTRLRFVLSREGNVEFVEPVISSGYPNIDMECVKYLKQWRFSPKSGDEDQKDWGIITLDLKTE